MYNVIQLTADHTSLLTKFCRAADAAGYINNGSLPAMKFLGKYDLEAPATFWGIEFNGTLISVSGCHVSNGSMRCLFRSATLPEFDSVVPGLSKNHMNSLPFSVMLIHQIALGLESGITEFYITTSSGEHDASGKMKRTHRAMQLLARTGLVSYLKDEIVYNTEQSLWNIDLEKYLRALESFEQTRSKIGIHLTEKYVYDLVLLRNYLTAGTDSTFVDKPIVN